MSLFCLLEEVLRLYTPGQITYRKAIADEKIAAVRVPAGTLVAVCIGAANRDPDIFSDPLRFQPGRVGVPVLSFGKGVHYCVGAHVAKVAAKVFLNVFQPWNKRYSLSGNEMKYANTTQVFRIEELDLKYADAH